MSPIFHIKLILLGDDMLNEDIKDPQKTIIQNGKINNKIKWGREETVNSKVVKVPAINFALPNKEGWHQRFSKYENIQRHNGLFAVKYYLKNNPSNFIVLERELSYPYSEKVFGYNTFLNNKFVDDEDFFKGFNDGKYLMEIAKRDGGMYKNIQRAMKRDNINKKEEDLYDKTIKEDVNYFPY